MIQVINDISHYWGSARNQETKPTCLAFVVSDINAASNNTQNLSVEYLCHHAVKRVPSWAGEGFTTDVIFQAVAQDGQPYEHLYPYLPHDTYAPLKAPPSNFSPIYYANLQTINCSASELKKVLLEHTFVGIVIAVTKSFFKPNNGLVSYDPLAIVDVYHALIVTGFGIHKVTQEIYFLVRNSWGTNWGVNGYCWLPQSLLDLHLVEVFTLDKNGKTI